ncbi:MAG: hypothetical protein ACOC16_01265 [Nanoarchaeota archaeon]
MKKKNINKKNHKKNKKFVFKFNFITNILILCSLIVGGIVWGDTNGIWHKAEDIKPGIFGGDEGHGDYYFSEKVDIKGNFCLKQECREDWSHVCTRWLKDNSIN